MADRLRALLDRPLDPSAARAILVLASASLVGFAALFVLAAGEPDQSTSAGHPSAATSSPSPVVPTQAVEGDSAEGQAAPHRQDPQDVEGSAAARRAARALRSHRSLQHVPYRSEGLTVDLVGAHGRRAVLRVRAATVQAARRAWRHFLRRYHDSGHAYLPIFQSKSGEAR
jgi:hypothetical protein